jgi:hypothetical protein
VTDLMLLPTSALAHAKARPRVKGHAAMPGSGPDSETCGSCKHLARITYANTYLKCELSRPRWTGGPGTDVRAKDPSCEKWEAPS